MRHDPVPMIEAFRHLRSRGRGDSARGRNLQALLLLDLCWTDERLPLAHYRPKRSPEAFLAMVFDLVGNLPGRRSAGPCPVAERLDVPFERFLTELSAHAPGLASELEQLVARALLDPRRSTLPSFLERLHLYLSPPQLERVDPDRVIAALPMAEVFTYLGYHPPEPGAGSERHPIGRDLRKAFRAELDAVWASALAGRSPSLVQLAACFPLDFVTLAERLPVPLSDFGFFYALATDASAPGRRWHPPAAYIGGEGARDDFEELCRSSQTPMSRLGLSGTLPRTVARLDQWLGRVKRFASLHAGRAWRRHLRERADEIAMARLRFLDELGRGMS